MNLTLPASPTPDALEAILVLSTDSAGRQYRLRFAYVSDDCHPTTCDLIEIEGVHASYLMAGEGVTPADALMDMFGDIFAEGLKLPAEVALALRELGHQAVPIVCQRLSERDLESVVFAEEHPAPIPEPSTHRSEPIYRAGATPWTPRSCAAVDRLDTSKYAGQPNPGRGVRPR